MNRLTKVESSSVLIKDGWKKKDTENYTSICYGCEEIGRCVNKCGFYKALEKLAAYEDTGLEPEEVKQLNASDASKEESSIKYYNEMRKYRDELKYYKKLEEQGLLIKLPPITKEDTLYWIWGDKIMPVKCRGIDTGVTYKMTTEEDRTFSKINGGKFTYEKGNTRFFYADDFGKTVFLTREEAEKALEGNE